MTNSEAFQYLAARKAHCEFLSNEATGQVGMRFTFGGHALEQWFPTEPLNRSNGPLIAAIVGQCGVHESFPPARSEQNA